MTDRKWVPVTERLPEDNHDVLVLVSGKHKNITFENAYMIGAYLRFGGEGWFCDEYPDWDDPGVTHWMELPELPEVEQ